MNKPSCKPLPPDTAARLRVYMKPRRGLQSVDGAGRYDDEFPTEPTLRKAITGKPVSPGTIRMIQKALDIRMGTDTVVVDELAPYRIAADEMCRRLGLAPLSEESILRVVHDCKQFVRFRVQQEQPTPDKNTSL